jgi:hypothetical protein
VNADTTKKYTGTPDPKGFPVTLVIPAATSRARTVAEDLDDSPHRAVAAGESDFRLAISAKCGDLVDPYNYLGVAPGAKDGHDPLDVMDPPMPGESVTIGFSHPDWGRNAGAFGEDLRAGIGQGQTWNLSARTTVKNGGVTLTWPNISELPKKYQILLYDSDAKRTVNMRSRSSFTFAAPGDGSEKRFTITVKPDSLAGLQVTDVAVAPTRGGGASVSYNLSRDADVAVYVTSLNGRRIRELPAGSRGPGIGTATWDGRDSQGRKAPRGLYVFEVIARAEDGRMVHAVAPGAVR